MSDQSEKWYPSLSLSSFVPMEDWCHHILQGRNMITLPIKEIGTLTVNQMYLLLILLRKRTWFRPALIKGWEFEMLCSLVSSGIRGIDKVRFNVDSESQKSVSHNAAVKNSRTRKEISYCRSCEASFRQAGGRLNEIKDTHLYSLLRTGFFYQDKLWKFCLVSTR
jgi:hypothetical protein